jgi:hypothetical protein
MSKYRKIAGALMALGFIGLIPTLLYVSSDWCFLLVPMFILPITIGFGMCGVDDMREANKDEAYREAIHQREMRQLRNLYRAD